MEFSGLYGHNAVKESLGRAIARDRISNSYVFDGITGVGKKLCADLFAQALVCEESSACGVCHACQLARANTHPDIIRVTKEKDKTVIGIDVVRSQVLSEAFLKPRNSRRKVFLIGEGDLLGIDAQNALLKVLEEPPSYVTFIVCVTNKEKLLPTVLSRSQVISFFPLGRDLVESYLKDTLLIPADSAALFARLAQGSIGAASELAQKSEKSALIEKSIASLCSLKNNSQSIREMVDFFTEESDHIEEIIFYLTTFLRDCVLVKTDMAESVVFEKELAKIRVFISDIGKKRLISAFDKLNSLKVKLKQNLNFNATVSETVVRIWEDFHDKGSGHKI